MMALLSWILGREAPERRVQTIEVTAEALLGMFQLDGTKILRMDGVPKDAKAHSMWVDESRQVLQIAVESSEFPVVAEGTLPQSVQVLVYVTDLKYAAVPVGQEA